MTSLSENKYWGHITGNFQWNNNTSEQFMIIMRSVSQMAELPIVSIRPLKERQPILSSLIPGGDLSGLKADDEEEQEQEQRDSHTDTPVRH